MLGTLGRFSACLVAAGLIAGLVRADEPTLAPAPEDGVLLLRNGQVIEGKITRAGDLYYVVFPDGEARLRAAEVELCCRNLEEGYQRKRAAVQVGSVSEHLRLAQWCQRHRLFDLAAAELAEARRADPNSRMVGLAERRLQTALEPPQQTPPPAAPVVQPVSFDELDRTARGLPHGSMETFTQTIQPLLMNSCATGGCHGPQSDAKLRLLRIPSGRPPSRRLTQRNLYEVLQCLDQKRPEASPLLTVPIQPHGTAKTAVFNDRQVVQYKRLVDWVYEVTRQGAVEVPATVQSGKQPPVQAMRTELPGFDFPETKAAPPSEALPSAKQQQEPTAKHTVKRGATLEPFLPADAFDPEIFNRRFFGASSGEAASGNSGE